MSNKLAFVPFIRSADTQMASCGYDRLVAWFYENFSRPRKKWFLVVVMAASVLTFGLYRSISREPYHESYEFHHNCK